MNDERPRVSVADGCLLDRQQTTIVDGQLLVGLDLLEKIRELLMFDSIDVRYSGRSVTLYCVKDGRVSSLELGADWWRGPSPVFAWASAFASIASRLGVPGATERCEGLEDMIADSVLT